MAALASELSIGAATDELLRRAATMDEAALSEIGSDLIGVGAVLADNPQVRRLMTDGTAPEDVRVGLARRLFDDKIAEASRALLSFAVGQEWSNGRDLVDGVRRLGRTALFLRAERAHELDAVEDELFRFGRILAANPEIGLVLDNPATATDARVHIVRQLLADKVKPLTSDLLIGLAGDPGGRSFAHGVTALVEQAAHRRDKVVAVATSALPLPPAETSRLASALSKIYGRAVVVHVVVDESIGGGLRIRVGDEVIDGSIAGRLQVLRAQLAR